MVWSGRSSQIAAAGQVARRLELMTAGVYKALHGPRSERSHWPRTRRLRDRLLHLGFGGHAKTELHGVLYGASIRIASSNGRPSTW